MKRLLYLFFLCLTASLTSLAQSLNEKYNDARPLIIVGDWDKAPYEFLNDRGEPAGTNIDLLKTICKELGIPCKFVLKEWSGALKAFERDKADLILANVRRFRRAPFYYTENVINYNRICAATYKDTTDIITNKALIEGGTALKPSDYTAIFFRDLDSLDASKIEFQSPKVA